MMGSHNSPSRIIPQRGKITEDHGKSSSHKRWAVLHEYVSRSNFTDNARHLPPQSAPLSSDAFAFAGNTDVLTRKASRHHVNSASPRASVKGSYVIPDREGWQASVVLPGDQHVPCVGVEFDGADGSPTEKVSAEKAASSASEKCQLIHRFL
jgi:hypothetical protein